MRAYYYTKSIKCDLVCDKIIFSPEFKCASKGNDNRILALVFLASYFCLQISEKLAYVIVTFKLRNVFKITPQNTNKKTPTNSYSISPANGKHGIYMSIIIVLVLEMSERTYLKQAIIFILGL